MAWSSGLGPEGLKGRLRAQTAALRVAVAVALALALALALAAAPAPAPAPVPAHFLIFIGEDSGLRLGSFITVGEHSGQQARSERPQANPCAQRPENAATGLAGSEGKGTQGLEKP